MKRFAPFLTLILFSFGVLTSSGAVLARGGDSTTEHASEAATESEHATFATKEAEVKDAIEHRAAAIVHDDTTGETHSEEERTKSCEERKTGIATKVKRLQTNAARFETRITGYLTKAQTYITDNKLSSDDLAAKLQAATDAQTKAAAAVDELKDLSPNIDCADHNVATEVAKIKAAAEQARSALKAYKAAVQAVYETVGTINDAEAK